MPKRILYVIGRAGPYRFRNGNLHPGLFFRGRISSLVADSFKIKRIICFGYPFPSPTEGENPDRYRHLAGLRTPMLIIQGNQDEYGGLEAGRNIPLSASIGLFFIDSKHDYRLEDLQWRTVLSKIESTLAPGFIPERHRHYIEGPWPTGALRRRAIQPDI